MATGIPVGLVRYWKPFLGMFLGWYFIAGCFMASGGNGMLVGVGMVFVFPVVLPIVFGLYILVGTKLRWNRNERIVRKVQSWQRAGKLHSGMPFSPEEDRLLLQAERRMAEIQKVHNRPLLHLGGAAVGIGWGAWEILKLPGRIGRGIRGGG